MAEGLQTYLNAVTHHGMVFSLSGGSQVSRKLASSISGIQLVIKICVLSEQQNPLPPESVLRGLMAHTTNWKNVFRSCSHV